MRVNYKGGDNMRTDYFYYGDMRFERVTKSTARKAFNDGRLVRIAPINASMTAGVFQLWAEIQKDYWSCEGHSFDSIVNNFEYYNLQQGAGNYTKYYVY